MRDATSLADDPRIGLITDADREAARERLVAGDLMHRTARTFYDEARESRRRLAQLSTDADETFATAERSVDEAAERKRLANALYHIAAETVQRLEGLGHGNATTEEPGEKGDGAGDETREEAFRKIATAPCEECGERHSSQVACKADD